MAIELDKPVKVPATVEKVYDKLWVVQQMSSSPNFGACALSAKLRPYRINGNVYEFSPIGRINFHDANLFLMHETKPHAVDAIRDAIAEMGITVPEGVPAQLYVMEILARAWGAAAQAKKPVDEYGGNGADEYGTAI